MTYDRNACQEFEQKCKGIIFRNKSDSFMDNARHVD